MKAKRAYNNGGKLKGKKGVAKNDTLERSKDQVIKNYEDQKALTGGSKNKPRVVPTLVRLAKEITAKKMKPVAKKKASSIATKPTTGPGTMCRQILSARC